MRFPISLYLSMTGYLLGKRFQQVDRFPLVLMLEPTHRCNLQCAGCGRIREYRETLGQELSLEECTPTVVSASSGYINNDNSVLSFQHTVSGSNRLLLVGVCYRPNFIATSVTWNGTSMQGEMIASGTNVRTEIYKLVAPEAGTYNIQIQFAGYVFAAAGAVTLTNVNQTTPLETSSGTLGNSSAPSLSVASNSGDLVFGVVDAYNFDETGRNADTLHWNTETWYAYSEGVTKAGSAGSTSLTWTLAGSGEWGVAGVAVKGTTFGVATNALAELKATERPKIKGRFTAEKRSARS